MGRQGVTYVLLWYTAAAAAARVSLGQRGLFERLAEAAADSCCRDQLTAVDATATASDNFRIVDLDGAQVLGLIRPVKQPLFAVQTQQTATTPPVATAADRSPVTTAATRSPLTAAATRSPVTAAATRSPVATAADRSPVATATKSPVATAGALQTVLAASAVAAVQLVTSAPYTPGTAALFRNTSLFRKTWQKRGMYSKLAKRIQEHQTSCGRPAWYHVMGGHGMGTDSHGSTGMGADLHSWTQALCNAMEHNGTLQVPTPSGPPWTLLPLVLNRQF